MVTEGWVASFCRKWRLEIDLVVCTLPQYLATTASLISVLGREQGEETKE